MENIEKVNKSNKIKKIIKENIVFLFMFSLCIVFLFNFKLIEVSGNSMDSTLKNGELHLAKLTKDLIHNDIIIAESEVLRCVVIKRVIGVPGDTIEIKDNVIYVNDKALTEEYLNEPMITDDIPKFKLGEDEYFVCGDNRNHSSDSRVAGPIHKKEIIGKLLF